MRIAISCLCVVFLGSFLSPAHGQNWPQWRGLNRDARASGFETPATWPKELVKKWQVTVGDGVATPALVDGKLYVFTREGGDEILRCLAAETGQELWRDNYAAEASFSGDRGFPGPRASPAVAAGKVVTLGVAGTLSCLDAATGKVLWRKDDYKGNFPMFHTSSSPIIWDGLAIAQLGGRRNGGLLAYDLETGAEKWKWTGDGPAYASPTLMQVGETMAIFAPTEQKLVAVNAADGALLWEVLYSQGRYNAASPIVQGQTLIYAGPNRGVTAEKIELAEGKINATPVWKNDETSVQFNTPVVREGFVYGISNTGGLFCVNAESGQQAWAASAAGAAEPNAAAPAPDTRPRPPVGRPGGAGGRPGRGGGGGAGYGSVVDAGQVLLALSPAGKLIVFAPTAKEFQQLAAYDVGTNTYAYPIPAGNRIYVKDANHLTCWTLE